jgi:hypothetical protein
MAAKYVFIAGDEFAAFVTVSVAPWPLPDSVPVYPHAVLYFPPDWLVPWPK